MKIGFNPGSIVDASGAPLQGRVLVYVHDSLEKKSIYTMEGSEYVASENPVLLDTTGRIPTTLFFDVGVVDVLVQKYVGAPGQLADESPDEDFEDFDRFEAGFDFDPEQEAARTVETIADLKDIENPSGIVRVNCYTTPGDTSPRYYLWNPNCTASEDGGCVIADTHDASGMWCYLCEGDSIKSSVYGIKPGTDEANLGAFCAAPLGVSGDYTITYPTTLYIEQGMYTNGNSYSVTNGRKTLFSCKAKFTNAMFYGLDFDVDGHNLDYVADFYIMSSDRRTKVSAHSSWFRTATYFWTCGAGILNLDKTNYFAFVTIGSMLDVMNAVVIGSNNLYAPTFVNSGCLHFDDCTFIGRAIFDKDNLVAKFTNCNFSDYLFSGANYNNVDFGTIAGGHKIEVDSWKITDAQNADVWLAWANAAGMSIVDLCGRSVTTLYNSNISEFRNGVFFGTVSTNVNVKFTDIGGSITVYPMNGGKSLTLDHCNSVNISSDMPFSSIVVRDSIVVLNTGIDSSVTSYSQDGGALSATFKCAGWNASSGTHAKGNEVNLRNVILHIGNFSWFDCVRMHNCIVNNPIQVIPYYENSDLWIDAIFAENTFGNNGYIAFGDSSVGNADIYGVKVNNIIIKDNVFYTSGNGVMMPFYSNNAFEPYIAPLQELNATYSGNVGSCPAESIEYGPNEMQALFVQDQGTYKRSLAVRRVWNLSKYAVSEHGSGLQISADNTQSRFVTPYIYHERSVENAGDQFDVFLAVKSSDYVATSIFKAFDK
jgi:hypothetical protein